MTGAERSVNRIPFWFATGLVFLVALTGCKSSGPGHSALKGDLSIYKLTNDQPGHEYVKTETFLVPVGSLIRIKGLEFERDSSTLSSTQRLIVQQIFNSIEEITENTPGDTNAARVEEFKKMKFEIRGYPDTPGNRDLGLAEQRAKAVLNLLTYLGTPKERLTLAVSGGASVHSGNHGRVEFIRIR
jgi:outer membrane protein OmpA-like peptidoglycan-associated protein